MGSSWGSGLGCVSRILFLFFFTLLCFALLCLLVDVVGCSEIDGLTVVTLGVLDREGNARKVVNCSCVVVRDWGEESQERAILLNYFQTEQ